MRTDINDNKIHFFPPIGGVIKETLPVLKEFGQYEKKQVVIERFHTSNLPDDWNFKVSVQNDRDNWDYVYSTKDLASFEGGKYANIRKKLNRFEKTHQVEYKRFNENQIELILSMQDEWCEMRKCEDDDDLSAEHAAINEIFTLWDVLQFGGGVLCKDEKVLAYCLGEKLNSNTLVTHIEKASLDFDGAYQSITKNFNLDNLGWTEFTNREQDVGDEGLRTAKERLQPIRYIEKSVLSLD